MLIALAIIFTTAATLHKAGVTTIETSTQAAEALRPIAGDFAFLVFALGIIGTGMLAVPVLAGSAAYAVGEACKWPVGLSRKPSKAAAFYGTLAASTVLGMVYHAYAARPHQSAVLERGHQRGGGRAGHDRDDADDRSPQDHGQIHSRRLAALARMGVHGSDGGVCCRYGRRVIRVRILHMDQASSRL